MNYGIDEKISKPLLYRKLTNDKVINITGEGGAGKSTLCENFRKNANEYIVIDFDSINLNNNKVGTLEYDLVKLIVNKYGKDIFPQTHHRNGEKQMLINEEFFEKCSICFATIYDEIINYLAPTGKVIVIDGSQYRFVNDASKIKGEFIALRTSLETCLNQSFSRHKKLNQEETEEQLFKHRQNKKEMFKIFNPLLNSTINTVANLSINKFDNNFKEELRTSLSELINSILENNSSSLSLEEQNFLKNIQAKKVITMNNYLDIIPKFINTPNYLEQLNISKTISSKPFLLTNNAILINLDELYLNGYRKVEDIINLFTEELKSYLNIKSLDQSL